MEAMKKLAVHWFDKPLTGKFPGNLDDPPDAVRIRGMNFVRTRGAPRHGATHQYREDVTHDSAHMYVTPTGEYVVDHRDRVSPHHSMVGHFARDFVPSVPKLIRERIMSPSHESTKKSAYDFAMQKIASIANEKDDARRPGAATGALAAGVGLTTGAVLHRATENLGFRRTDKDWQRIERAMDKATSLGRESSFDRHRRLRGMHRKLYNRVIRMANAAGVGGLIGTGAAVGGVSKAIAKHRDREKSAASFAHQAPPPVHEYEQMSPAKWKRAIPDTLASVAGMGIGYGVSRTLMDRLGERYAQEGRKLPGLAKYVPLIGTVGSGAVGYGMSRTRSLLKKRREEAEAAAQAEKEKKSGVEPAPQSRAIPKKKPTDPWNYDPNPAYDL